jgi:GNAT superfamily N-acetyltransferase
MRKQRQGPRLVRVVPQSDLEASVIALSKRHQKTLGQLPYEVFHEAALKGELVATTVDGELAGYVLYRTTRKRLVLTQLCVSQDFRGKKLARRLVDEVAKSNPLASGIRVQCRTDYDAHGAWPQLGFDWRSEIEGRGKDKMPLTVWWRRVSDQSLFDVGGSTPAAAIDVNVFRDIVEDRAEHQESIALTDDWLTGHIELVATGELTNELAGGKTHTSHLMAFVNGFRTITLPPEAWEPTATMLAATLGTPSVGTADLRQIARAAAGGATYFVTRDEKVLAHAELISELIGLITLRPADLLIAAHAAEHVAEFRPSALSDTELRTYALPSVPTTDELGPFTDHTSGERTKVLRTEIVNAMSDPQRSMLTCIADERDVKMSIALADHDPEVSLVTVTKLRTRVGPSQHTLARQHLHLIRQTALTRGAEQLRFNDVTPAPISDALLAEGWSPRDEGWGLAMRRTMLTSPTDEFEGTALTDMTPEQVSEAERSNWPLILATGSVPTYIIPIRPYWAGELLNHRQQAKTLLARSDQLGISREHTYYRAARGELSAPARILWWVSGGGLDSGLRAHSWLEEVEVGPAERVFRRNRRRGIYNLYQVKARAGKSDKVMALRFGRTELFNTPFPLRVAEKIYAPLGDNGSLQTLATVDERVFVSFLREDSRNAPT